MSVYQNNEESYSEMIQDYPLSLDAMHSGIVNSDTISMYQRQNNREEINRSLSWGERLDAAGTGLAHGVTSYAPEQILRAMRTIGKIFHSEDLQAFASEEIDKELEKRRLDPYYKVPKDWMDDGWGRSLYEGFRGVSSSSLAMLPPCLFLERKRLVLPC